MKKDDDKPNIGLSILGGIVFTLVLLIFIPALCGEFIMPYVIDFVGDTTFITFSSNVIVNIIMWLIIIGFTFAFGCGQILKRFGVFGIIGLVLVYWWFDNLIGAVYAIATLLIVTGIMYLIKSRSDKKKECQS